MALKLTGPVLAACLAAPIWAQAQDNDTYPPTVPQTQLPAPGETIPEQTYPCNPGSFKPAEGKDDPDLPYAYDCDGVIDPPSGIDPAIKTTPPEPKAGTMPVIPPDDMKSDTSNE